jgi:tripeptide aminopeptidase
MQTLLDLCRIPSPSGQEGRVAAYIRARAAALGVEVEEDGAGPALGSDTGNLLLRVRGRGEPLFFSAHMDTVPPPAGLNEIPLMQEEDRVHTGGVSVLGYDDKGGVAALLELAEIAVERQGEMLPLELLFTIQEERGLRGSKFFDASRLQARAGFVLDNEAEVGSCLSAQPTKLAYSVEVRGKAAHAAVAPEQGINAIKALGAIINEFPTGKIDDETVMNLGKIEGGGASNIVPDLAVLTGEMRGFSEQKLQALLARLEQSAVQTAARFGATAAFTWETTYTAYHTVPTSRSARLFAAACQAEGIEAVFEQSLGGSDANNFSQKGLACLNIGLEMNNIHSKDEFMRPSQFLRTVQLVERIILDWHEDSPSTHPGLQ